MLIVRHHSQVWSLVSSHVVLWVRVVAGYDLLQKVSVGIGPVLISVSVSVSVSGLQSSAPLPHGLLASWSVVTPHLPQYRLDL